MDDDCNQGYCENKKCHCLQDFAYKEDCSLHGCKFFLQGKDFSHGGLLTRKPVQTSLERQPGIGTAVWKYELDF